MLQTTYHVQRTRTARESMSFRMRPKAPESLPVEFAEWTPPDEISESDWQGAPVEALELYGPPEREFQSARIVASRADLLRIVKSATRYSAPKSPKPILHNLKFSVNGTAEISATNFDTSGAFRLDGENCEHSGAAEFLLHPAELAKILAKVKSSAVQIDFAESRTDTVCTLTAGAAEFRLDTEDSAEFPAPWEFAPIWAVSVDVSDFRRVLTETVQFTDAESTRYALGGVHFEFHRDRLICSATDTRRLSVADCDVQVHGNPPAELDAREAGTTQTFGFCRAIVPAAALWNVLSDLPKTGGSVIVSVSADGNLTALQCGSMSVCTRNVEGRFPNYRDVIPRDCNHTISLDVAALTEAIEIANIGADCEYRGLDFLPIPSGGMSVRSVNGKAKCDVAAEHQVSGEFVPAITIDGRFLIDQLKLCGTERVELRLRDADSPMVIRNPHGRQFYVVMPLTRENRK